VKEKSARSSSSKKIAASRLARGAADQFAEAGLIAIAPDLLSGLAHGARPATSRRPTPPRQALGKLRPSGDRRPERVRRLRRELDSCNGKAVGGSAGGGQTFRFARTRERWRGAGVLRSRARRTPRRSRRSRRRSTALRRETTPASTPDEARRGGDEEAGKRTTRSSIRARSRLHARRRDDGVEGREKKARADAWTRIKEILKKL